MEHQLERFAQAIHLGGDLPSLVDQIRNLEQRRADLHTEGARLEHLAPTPPTTRQFAELESEVLARLAQWTQLMRRCPHETRQRLADLLTKRMMWTPRVDTTGFHYEFTAECSIGQLVTGVARAAAIRSLLPIGLTPNATMGRSTPRPWTQDLRAAVPFGANPIGRRSLMVRQDH